MEQESRQGKSLTSSSKRLSRQFKTFMPIRKVHKIKLERNLQNLEQNRLSFCLTIWHFSLLKSEMTPQGEENSHTVFHSANRCTLS